MRAMTRDTLETILSEAPGSKVENAKTEGATAKAEKNGDKKSARPPAASEERTYGFGEEHRVSLYLSLGETGTVVSEVTRVTLGTVLRVEQKDRTVLFVEYGAVHGLSIRPPRNTGEATKTGF
jgi:hypothetical protein